AVRCIRQTTCRFRVSNTLLGELCRGAHKTLTVQYTCERQCPFDYFGTRCANVCSEHCEKPNNLSTCHVITGACPDGCVAGYKGDNCDMHCENERYGPGCTSRCSHFCERNSSLSTCNASTGSCFLGCLPGYNGDNCDLMCSNETYGYNCTNDCSPNCKYGKGRICDLVNGTCFYSCINGYTGLKCDIKVCSNETYGYNCTNDCSPNCKYGKGRICDLVNGTCFYSCINGYTGLKCDFKVQTATMEKAASVIMRTEHAFIVVKMGIQDLSVTSKLQRKSDKRKSYGGRRGRPRYQMYDDTKEEIVNELYTNIKLALGRVTCKREVFRRHVGPRQAERKQPHHITIPNINCTFCRKEAF
ncbi:multiple epidermal growth factor-like domains 6, partial [Elysia marginata]